MRPLNFQLTSSALADIPRPYLSDPCSAILLRPTRLGAGRSQKRQDEILKRESMSEYELQMDVKRRMKLMLQSEEKVCLS